MDDIFPFQRRDLYQRYLTELKDAGFTAEQARAMLKIWWELMGWQ